MAIVRTENRHVTIDYVSGKGQIRRLIRESAPYQQACNCLSIKKIWS
jgi:hypothetical protein